MKGTAKFISGYGLVVSILLITAIFVAYTHQGTLDISASVETAVLRDQIQKGHVSISAASQQGSAGPGMVRTRVRVAPQTQALVSVVLMHVVACVALIAVESEFAPKPTSTAVFVPPEA